MKSGHVKVSVWGGEYNTLVLLLLRIIYCLMINPGDKLIVLKDSAQMKIVETPCR